MQTRWVKHRHYFFSTGDEYHLFYKSDGEKRVSKGDHIFISAEWEQYDNERYIELSFENPLPETIMTKINEINLRYKKLNKIFAPAVRVDIEEHEITIFPTNNDKKRIIVYDILELIIHEVDPTISRIRDSIYEIYKLNIEELMKPSKKLSPTKQFT